MVCNFDPYYSPLPYYAERPMANNLRTYAGMARRPRRSAEEPAVGGIAWMGEPGAAELSGHCRRRQTKRVEVDGISFCLWLPGAKRSGDVFALVAKAAARWTSRCETLSVVLASRWPALP